MQGREGRHSVKGKAEVGMWHHSSQCNLSQHIRRQLCSNRRQLWEVQRHRVQKLPLLLFLEMELHLLLLRHCLDLHNCRPRSQLCLLVKSKEGKRQEKPPEDGVNVTWKSSRMRGEEQLLRNDKRTERERNRLAETRPLLRVLRGKIRTDIALQQ